MKSWSNSEIPHSGHYVPEKRLLAAVLQRAITDFVSGEGDLVQEAGAWLLNNGAFDDSDDESSEPPLTFDFICEALDLDIVSLRKAILNQATTAPQVFQEVALN